AIPTSSRQYVKAPDGCGTACGVAASDGALCAFKRARACPTGCAHDPHEARRAEWAWHGRAGASRCVRRVVIPLIQAAGGCTAVDLRSRTRRPASPVATGLYPVAAQ